MVIPVTNPAEVWYVHPDLPTLTAIVDGPLEAVRLSADAHAYCDEDGKLLRTLVNPLATALRHRAVPEIAGNGVLVGDVIVLGRTSRDGDESDCPQWAIDAVTLAAPPGQQEPRRHARAGTGPPCAGGAAAP